MRRKTWLLFLFLLCAAAGDAWAVVGRPLTPMSYAGVARRTSRRTVRRTAYYSGGAYYGGAATIAALPGGCLRSGPYYSCGGLYYKPYYDGPDLVYVQVENPS